MNTIIKIAEEQGMKLLGGIIVLGIGFFLVRWIMKFLTRNAHLNKIEPTIRNVTKIDHQRARTQQFVLVVVRREGEEDNRKNPCAKGQKRIQ